MNLISTSKLRRGRLLLEDTEPYFNQIQAMMSVFLKDSSRVKSKFFGNQEKTGRTAIVAVTSDKGLAGGYNANVFHRVNELAAKVEKPVLVLVGNVGQRYFVNSEYMVLENFSYQSRLPKVADAEEIADFLISQYEWGVFEAVYVVYTHMYNSLKLAPEIKQILPLDAGKILDDKDTPPENADDAADKNVNLEHVIGNKESITSNLTGGKPPVLFEYIPSAEAVFDKLAPQYIKGVLYGCLVEAYASEQSSRMTAMDEASRNAKDMIAAKQLFYNRVRQAGITQEVTEIVAGSAALK
jgi:F-type H+-transporting ATPase subunit gamma